MKKIMVIEVLILTVGCSLSNNNITYNNDTDTGPTITIVIQNDTVGYTKAGFFSIGSIENFHETFDLYKEVPIINGHFTFNLPRYKPINPYMYTIIGDENGSVNMYIHNCIDTVQAVGNNNEIYKKYVLKGLQSEGSHIILESACIICDTSKNDWILLPYTGGSIDKDTTIYWDLSNY